MPIFMTRVVSALCMTILGMGLSWSPLISAQGEVYCLDDYSANGGTEYQAMLDAIEQCTRIDGNITIEGQFSDTSIDFIFGGGELNGTLTIRNTNLTSFRSDADLTLLGENSYQVFALRKVDKLIIENNANLALIEIDELRRPPNDISVKENPNLTSFYLTPDTNPLADSYTLTGSWIFTDNGFGASVDADRQRAIEIGFPTLKLNLLGDLKIERNGAFAGPMFDFSGLREVRNLSLINLTPPSASASLGTVTYGVNNSFLTVSVTEGFADLEQAEKISIILTGLSDISFPSLERLQDLDIRERDVVDVHFPKVPTLRTLYLTGLGSKDGRDFGDRTGLGNSWGFGSLWRVESNFTLGIKNTAAATSLGALNLASPSISIGVPSQEPIISITVEKPEFSLMGIREVVDVLDTFKLQGWWSFGSRTFDTKFTNINAFAEVTEVTRDLWLHSINSVDLAQGSVFSVLPALRTIGGRAYINNINAKTTSWAQASFNGAEKLQFIGGNLEVYNSRVGQCHALLPLLGWNNLTSRVLGSSTRTGNLPDACNDDNFTTLKQQGLSAFSILQSSPAPGGVKIRAGLPSASELFPIQSFEASCSANFRESHVAFGGGVTFPGSATSERSVTFDNVGKIDAFSVGVEFSSIDRSQVSLYLKAPSYGKSLALCKDCGTGTKAWKEEFSSDQNTLRPLQGFNANGDWTLIVNTGSASASFKNFYVDLDTLYVESTDAAANESDEYFEITLQGLPPGDSFQCTLTALNNIGVRQASENQWSATTPPAIPGAPVITSLESDGDGVYVYFTPPDYFPDLWAGSVMYTAVCTADTQDGGVTVTRGTSEPGARSPAFIPGLNAEQALTCSVTMDNLYESVTSNDFYGKAEELVGGLPIWLLYEASK